MEFLLKMIEHLIQGHPWKIFLLTGGYSTCLIWALVILRKKITSQKKRIQSAKQEITTLVSNLSSMQKEKEEFIKIHATMEERIKKLSEASPIAQEKIYREIRQKQRLKKILHSLKEQNQQLEDEIIDLKEENTELLSREQSSVDHYLRRLSLLEEENKKVHSLNEQLLEQTSEQSKKIELLKTTETPVKNNLIQKNLKSLDEENKNLRNSLYDTQEKYTLIKKTNITLQKSISEIQQSLTKEQSLLLEKEENIKNLMKLKNIQEKAIAHLREKIDLFEKESPKRAKLIFHDKNQ